MTGDPLNPVRGRLNVGRDASAWATLVTIAHLGAYGLGVGSIVQLPLALLFYCTCPGSIILDWVDIDQPLARFSVVVALSLAANAVIVTFLLFAGWFSPLSGALAISFTTMLVALVRPSGELVEAPV